MAEEIGTGVFCGSNWWDRTRSTPFVSPSPASLCSTVVIDDVHFAGNFSRSADYCSMNIKSTRSCKDTSSDSPARVSGSNFGFGSTDFEITGSSNERSDENDDIIDSILREDMDLSRVRDWSLKSFSGIGTLDDSSMDPVKHLNQEIPNNSDQSGPAKCTSPSCQETLSANAFAFGCSANSIIQSLMDPDDEMISDHSSIMNFVKYDPPLLKPASFNNTDLRSAGFPMFPGALSQLGSFSGITLPPPLGEKVAYRSDFVTRLEDGDGEHEPVYKRPRIETPLPTFKVRKEKLGDRVTALQQLVSPFGKTDTASVLHEAVEYIKYLHEQLNVLIIQHLQNGVSIHNQHQNSGGFTEGGDPKQDLRSRGLCLVPISSTSTVSKETSIWTPKLLDGSFL